MLAPLMQNMHHPLPIRCCLFEAKGDFPQNMNPVATVKKSREVVEDYLMTTMPCKPVLQDKNCSALRSVFAEKDDLSVFQG